MSNRIVLGIDIGGTNLRMGLVDEAYQLTRFERFPSQETLGGGSEGIKTRWMSWPQRVLLIVLSAAAVWGISRLLLKTDDPQPVSDALAMTVAVGAQFLLTFAFIEQWFMWIVVNGANLVMWAIAATRGVQFAPIMVVQYVFYMMNSIYGIVWWSKMSKKA